MFPFPLLPLIITFCHDLAIMMCYFVRVKIHIHNIKNFKYISFSWSGIATYVCLLCSSWNIKCVDCRNLGKFGKIDDQWWFVKFYHPNFNNVLWYIYMYKESKQVGIHQKLLMRNLPKFSSTKNSYYMVVNQFTECT